MRAVIQRVKSCEVKVENKTVGKIDRGILIFLGIKKDDTEKEIDYLLNKILNLRIFEYENGKMNLSVKDIKGEILVVSEFTLYGDCRKGNRPNYIEAAPALYAEEIYNKFIEKLKISNLKIETGIFRAMMEIYIVNDGPVTLIIDTKN